MEEIIIHDKQDYLNKNYPFAEPIKLEDIKYCIHCGNNIKVGEYKVYKDDTGFEFICCPNGPECNGSLIDWMEIDK